VAITGLVDEELVGALPEGLKFIAHNGMQPPIGNLLGKVRA